MQATDFVTEEILVGEIKLADDFVTAAPVYDFTRQSLRQELPAECFEKSGPLIARQLLISTFFTCAAFIGMAFYAPWFTLPFYWTLLGFCLYGFLAIGHECAHGNLMFKTWQNDLLGSVCYLAAFMPYEIWKQAHMLHHSNVAHFDREEYFGMRRERPKQRVSIVILFLMRFMPPVGLFLGHMLYLFGGRAKVGRLGVDNLYYNKKFNNRLALMNLASLALVLAGMGSLSLALSPWFVAKFIFIPMAMAGAVNLFVGYMQHRDEKNWVLGFAEGTWTRLRGDLQTVDRNFWPFNFLMHHAARHHVAHHLFPNMPHYRMPLAMTALAPILREHYRNDEDNVFLQYHETMANSRVVKGQGTLAFSA